MIQVPRCATIDKEVQEKLDKIATDKRHVRWNGKAKAVKSFKAEALKHGLSIQDHRCAWCMLEVGERGRRTAHRDHIAPKGRYPAWTFLPKNIVVSCEYCNGFLVKGETDTVMTSAADYDHCDFRLVHPYLDKPTEHISFYGDDDADGVLLRAVTDKGRWTIDLFRLDSGFATANRAKDKLFERLMLKLGEKDRVRFVEALKSIGA